MVDVRDLNCRVATQDEKRGCLCFYWQELETFKENHKIIDVPLSSLSVELTGEPSEFSSRPWNVKVFNWSVEKAMPGKIMTNDKQMMIILKFIFFSPFY